MKTNKNKLLSFLAVIGVLLLVGVLTGTETLVAADQAEMQPMMQHMGNMMGTTDNMLEGCNMQEMQEHMNMHTQMHGMIGSSGRMTQAEHESHHR